MSYSETIQYLFSLQKHGIKFGLDNISRLLSALENPQESFPIIHIAGTNGKGSTSAIIASILKAFDLRVGLFTSPHLISFTERIRVNNGEITEDEVVGLAEEIRRTILLLQMSRSDFSPTFFEVVTAMALLYFKRKEIDTAVVEVGMGGRLDATNIVIPEISVITNITYDHREFLGNTLKEIAYEKAGIIKKRIPVVVSPQVPEVLDIIEEMVGQMDTVSCLYGRDFSSVLVREDISGIHFNYSGSNSFMLENLYLPLIGEHQMHNASVAIQAVKLFHERKFTPKLFGAADTHHSSLIINSAIKEGLATVRWAGRLEMIQDNPPILIDGAHNPAAAVTLAGVLKKNYLSRYRHIILILGIMGDKDIKGIMKPLLPLASEIILTAPDYERAASPERLGSIASTLGFPVVRIAPSVRNAMKIAEDLSESAYLNSLIVITGSFYTIGEAKEFIGHKGVLTKLRE